MPTVLSRSKSTQLGYRGQKGYARGSLPPWVRRKKRYVQAHSLHGYGGGESYVQAHFDAVSKKTPRVGTSSTHNEYIAMAECARRLRFFQDLLTEMDMKQYVGRTPMAGDNWPATTQLHDRRITGRNRHYLSEFFWLYEMYADQKFTPC